MGLFGGKKQNTFLGVDIGASSIKVVELSNQKGRAKLMTYGYGEMPVNKGGSFFDDPKKTGLLLADICKKAGTKATYAMSALPSSNIFSAILSVPKTKDKKQLKPLIDSELAKLSPLPLTEMITYSTFIDDEKPKKKDKPKTKDEKNPEDKNKPAAPKQKYARVLVTGAAKTLVQKYIQIFKTAKLELQAIDTESFALIRSLIGKDKGAILILDFGSARTNLIVVEKGIPFVSRSINIGGNSITTRFADQMKISEDAAERAKIDLSTAANTLTSLPKILEPVMQPIVNEIRYTFELYKNMKLTELKKVEKIILTGGSSHLPQIPEYLSKALNINVYRGDPWARVTYPQDLSTVLEDIGPRMSVSVGLAMRELE
jgi:type IV pilus assembly protein PilM